MPSIPARAFCPVRTYRGYCISNTSTSAALAIFFLKCRRTGGLFVCPSAEHIPAIVQNALPCLLSRPAYPQIPSSTLCLSAPLA